MRRLNLFSIVAAFLLVEAVILPWIANAASEESFSIEQTFEKAKQSYLEKNMDSAAEQIKKSVSYMKAQAEKASDKGKKALNESAKEMEKLADDVKKGAVTSVKRIEKTFARAYVALASDSHVKSTELWAKQEKEKTADALDSAVTYLERSFAWAGQKIETQTKEAMKQSKELSVNLKQKGSVLVEDVGKNLKNAGNEIEKFGKRISAK